MSATRPLTGSRRPYLRAYLAQRARNANLNLYMQLMKDKVADPMTLAATSMAYGIAPNDMVLMAMGVLTVKSGSDALALSRPGTRSKAT